jgi:hypothetical protein
LSLLSHFMQDGYRVDWDGSTWVSGTSWNDEIRERWATQDSPRVPTVADDKREGGRSQTGAVLCSWCEQDHHSFKTAE